MIGGGLIRPDPAALRKKDHLLSSQRIFIKNNDGIFFPISHQVPNRVEIQKAFSRSKWFLYCGIFFLYAGCLIIVKKSKTPLKNGIIFFVLLLLTVALFYDKYRNRKYFDVESSMWLTDYVGPAFHLRNIKIFSKEGFPQSVQIFSGRREPMLSILFIPFVKSEKFNSEKVFPSFLEKEYKIKFPLLSKLGFYIATILVCAVGCWVAYNFGFSSGFLCVFLSAQSEMISQQMLSFSSDANLISLALVLSSITMHTMIKKPTFFWAICFGLAMGLFFYTRAIFVYLLPGIVVYLFYMTQTEKPKHIELLKCLKFSALTLLAVVVPFFLAKNILRSDLSGISTNTYYKSSLNSRQVFNEFTRPLWKMFHGVVSFSPEISPSAAGEILGLDSPFYYKNPFSFRSRELEKSPTSKDTVRALKLLVMQPKQTFLSSVLLAWRGLTQEAYPGNLFTPLLFRLTAVLSFSFVSLFAIIYLCVTRKEIRPFFILPALFALLHILGSNCIKRYFIPLLPFYYAAFSIFMLKLFDLPKGLKK